MARSASASSSGGLSLGHPFARPRDEGVAHRGLQVGLGEGRDDRGDRVDRPAPGVVLGDTRETGISEPSLRPSESAAN